MLTEQDLELQEIVYDFNKHGMYPTKAQIQSKSKFRQTNYIDVRLRRLRDKGYLKLVDGRGYAVLTPKLGAEFTQPLVVNEAQYLNAAGKDYLAWAILVTAARNKPYLIGFRNELLEHIDRGKLNAVFVATYLLKLLIETPDLVPSLDIDREFDDKQRTGEEEMEMIWDRLRKLGIYK